VSASRASTEVSPVEPEPAGETKIPVLASIGEGDTFTITRDGVPVTPTTTVYKIDYSTDDPLDVYETEPGDVITLDHPEAKGAVKAGYDYSGSAVKTDGTIDNLSTSTYPTEYTVTADDVLVSFYKRL